MTEMPPPRRPKVEKVESNPGCKGGNDDIYHTCQSLNQTDSSAAEREVKEWEEPLLFYAIGGDKFIEICVTKNLKNSRVYGGW
jgi:hypothetical protein